MPGLDWRMAPLSTLASFERPRIGPLTTPAARRAAAWELETSRRRPGKVLDRGGQAPEFLGLQAPGAGTRAATRLRRRARQPRSSRRLARAHAVLLGRCTRRHGEDLRARPRDRAARPGVHRALRFRS